MPVDSGSRLRFRWRASWLAVGAVVAVAGGSCNRDPTSQCIAWLVVGHASLGDDRTNVHGRNAVRPACGTTSPGSRARGECGDRRMPGTSVARSSGTSVQHPRGDQRRRRCRPPSDRGRDRGCPARPGQPQRGRQSHAAHTRRRAGLSRRNHRTARGLRTHFIYDGGPFGNAILTRYPVVESHNLRLPGTFGLEPRGLLTAIVIVDGRRIAFSSTHLTEGSDGRQSRALQAQAVARALHTMDAPTILAGDLNSDSTDLSRADPSRPSPRRRGGRGHRARRHLPRSQSQQQVRLHPLRPPLRRGAWQHTGAGLRLQRPSVGVHQADLAPTAPVLTDAHRTRTSAQIVAQPLWSNSTRAPTYPGRVD